MQYLSWFGIIILFTSCSSLTSFPASELESDYYLYHEKGKPYQKVYVDVMEDSTTIIKTDNSGNKGSLIVNNNDQIFLKRSFDLDVMVIPFKYRPPALNLPRQLTTEFNGNLFLGYRVDRFNKHTYTTPVGQVSKFHHTALSMGAFGGIGTTSVNPWTTGYQTTDEYNGFVFSRGISLMAGINNLTVGGGIGWDYLTDKDKNIWIYQNKVWYGLTLSVNLN